ncbi:MAG: hypothetical protein A3A86_08105 [Elusimicrobia bacterium RIFCSPLOWO2_01_FULL_60_11]|nr:MAG: hypothetical protein A3A86_08105 [Elusimicrobia bacterium RIFCSPLOWO2_01_FULL_60_11]
MSPESVLITGATGFIGMNLARELLSRGGSVHALKRKSSDPRRVRELEGFAKGKGRLTLHDAELTDFAAVSGVVQTVRPRTVFHLAARADTSLSMENALACFQDNISATYVLLEALKGMNIRSLVFASSTEVYGKLPVPFRETQTIRPPSPYGLSKAAAEEICFYFVRNHGLPVSIARIAVCYGPYMKGPRFMSNLFKACTAKAKGPELKFASAGQTRDFVHVDDIVSALIAASERKAARGEIFNLGLGKSHTVKQLVETACKLARFTPKMRWGVLPEPVHVNKVWKTGIGKAKKLLGWSPEVGLEEGLLDTLDHFRGSSPN